MTMTVFYLLGGFVVVCYYLWMDVALFYHLQIAEIDTNGKIHTTSGWSPLSEIHVKTLMMDHTDHYVISPLCKIFYEATNFNVTLSSWISANMVSVAHIPVAVVGSRLLTSENLGVRQLGVFVHELRNFLDGLDGIIARNRAQGQNYGYYVDGLCDAAGFFTLLVATAILLKKQSLRKGYVPLPTWMKFPSENGGNENRPLVPSWQRPFPLVICFGTILLLGSVFWNYYILRYGLLLDGPNVSHSAAQVYQWQSFWMLMWFWRLLNPFSFLQMFLISVFIDRHWEFLCHVQWLGLIFLGTLVMLTEVQVRQVECFLAKLPVSDTAALL